MKQTDEEIAQEYEEKELNIVDGEYGKFTITEAVLFGLRRGRELEAEKAMRFAEWTSGRYMFYAGSWKKLLMQHGDTYTVQTTEELYNSQEFAKYLKKFEK